MFFKKKKLIPQYKIVKYKEKAQLKAKNFTVVLKNGARIEGVLLSKICHDPHPFDLVTGKIGDLYKSNKKYIYLKYDYKLYFTEFNYQNGFLHVVDKNGNTHQINTNEVIETIINPEYLTNETQEIELERLEKIND